MRLIDADALDTRFEAEFDGVCVYDVSGSEAARDFCDIVDTAPTIDAIPVERLRDLLQQADDSGGRYLFVAEGIRFVLEMWEEEQEAR